MADSKSVKAISGKKDIKLVAIDMDGTTLLDDHASISEKTRKTIETTIAQGIMVVPATGRAVSAIPESVLEIPGLKYAITSNGSCISLLGTGETLTAEYLEERIVNELIAYLIKREVYFEVFHQGRILIEERLLKYRPEGWSVDAIKFLYRAMPDVGRYLQQAAKSENTSFVEKVIALNDAPELIEEIHSFLMREEGVTCSVNREETLSLEITKKGISKGSGLEKLCTHVGISLENAMAVGDNGNDLAMVRMAGVGVAMGNGTEEVKASADYVTLTNMEDGLALAMEKFLDLGEKRTFE